MKSPNDKFGKKVVDALNRIHSTGEGEIVVNALTNSKRNYNIKESEILFAKTPKQKAESKSASFSLGANGEYDESVNLNVNKKDYSKAQKLISNINELYIGAFDGNFDSAWKLNSQDPDGVKMNFEITLAHEIFHGYQFEIGSLSGEFLGGYIGKTDSNVTLLEAQAVGFENYVRASLFKGTKFGETRAHYSGIKIDEFFEEPDWRDYFLGFDKLDVKEFTKKGSAYDTWKVEFSKKAKETGEKILKTDN